MGYHLALVLVATLRTNTVSCHADIQRWEGFQAEDVSRMKHEIRDTNIMVTCVRLLDVR